MKHILKKGDHEFSPKPGVWRLHSGITFAEWRGHFDESTWYPQEEDPSPFNQGAGWSFGKQNKDAIRWGWRPVLHNGQKMQEICLCTLENGLRTISKETILLPLKEDFFVQLKTNGAFASLAARTFTGDWQMITGKWAARTKKGTWLGLALGDHHPSPQDMLLELKRLNPA
jgi:hypothetical protein